MANRLVRPPANLSPMSVLRSGVVTETGANTYTEVEIPMPVSPASFLAVRIHQIAFELGFPDTVAATRTATVAVLATRTLVGAPASNINVDGVIARANLVVDNAAVGGMYGDGHLPSIWDFGEQGLMVVDQMLHLGVLGTANTAAKTGRVVIYYTLESLEPDEWISALSVLGSAV